MPTYVYRGTECPHQFQVHQSFAEDPLTECTECGMPVRRVFQPTGLVFKGSGWYINDSRKSENGESPNGATTTDSAKPAAESPSKPAADSSAKPDSTSKAEPVAAGASKD